MSQAIDPEVISPEVSQPSRFNSFAVLFNGLTRMESAFVDHYLADSTGNAGEAARKAGYSAATTSHYVCGSRLLRRAKVQQEIKRRLGAHIASSEEVLERLTTHARADLTDVLTPEGEFNLKYAKKRGTSQLLKKLKVKKRFEKDAEGDLHPVTEYEYEIHDPQAALEKLGRFHRLFSDKIDAEVDTDSAKKMLIELIGEACKRMRAQEQERLSLTESIG